MNYVISYKKDKYIKYYYYLKIYCIFSEFYLDLMIL